MSVAACAALVEKGDPDRFLAAMAAPVPARAALFPLYAFNLEIARAPWVTAEPMIAEMRLQWWCDAVAEAAAGRVRAHEVMTPLADVIRARDLPVTLFEEMAEARRQDIWAEPMGPEALEGYLDATGGALMALGVRALGVQGQDAGARAVGRAGAAAAFLRALPELAARGKAPLAEDRPEALAALARRALGWLQEGRCAGLPRAAAPALRAAWLAGPALRRAAADPARVAEGRLQPSEAARRWGLLRRALAGGW